MFLGPDFFRSRSRQFCPCIQNNYSFRRIRNFVGVDTFVFGEEVYLDSIYEPAGLIKKAQVSIKANGTSIPFNFVPKQYSWEWNQKNII
ncbi:MAG: hypothetical protein Ct9H300mP29_7150 [Candidatus Neomarinimicrobiota bacterium]|nr:MAG: hypothetical protein Ct9H300mP29_7150 [Candidatus Neomarinimicrobiota bacterium]